VEDAGKKIVKAGITVPRNTKSVGKFTQMEDEYKKPLTLLVTLVKA
jgi:hypothetical protein